MCIIAYLFESGSGWGGRPLLAVSRNAALPPPPVEDVSHEDVHVEVQEESHGEHQEDHDKDAKPSIENLENGEKIRSLFVWEPDVSWKCESPSHGINHDHNG